MIFLNSRDDLEWAKEVHGVPQNAKAIVIYGNEDAPDKIEWYTKRNPSVNDIPKVIRYA